MSTNSVLRHELTNQLPNLTAIKQSQFCLIAVITFKEKQEGKQKEQFIVLDKIYFVVYYTWLVDKKLFYELKKK